VSGSGQLLFRITWRLVGPLERFREFLAEVLYGVVFERWLVQEREERGHFVGVEFDVASDFAVGIADRLRSDLGCRVVPNGVVLEGEEISEVECVGVVDLGSVSEREDDRGHSK
jgi:hypothetical protein